MVDFLVVFTSGEEIASQRRVTRYDVSVGVVFACRPVVLGQIADRSEVVRYTCAGSQTAEVRMMQSWYIPEVTATQKSTLAS
jgi:hypothetical protein